jgi:hypothetical protein
LEQLLALQPAMERILARVPIDIGINSISARSSENIIQFSGLTRDHVGEIPNQAHSSHLQS